MTHVLHKACFGSICQPHSLVRLAQRADAKDEEHHHKGKHDDKKEHDKAVGPCGTVGLFVHLRRQHVITHPCLDLGKFRLIGLGEDFLLIRQKVLLNIEGKLFPTVLFSNVGDVFNFPQVARHGDDVELLDILTIHQLVDVTEHQISRGADLRQ